MGHIYIIDGGPWCDGKVLLVGDSAHTVTPFLGQGMNCALEDCELLLACIDEHVDFEAAFRTFYERAMPTCKRWARCRRVI